LEKNTHSEQGRKALNCMMENIGKYMLAKNSDDSKNMIENVSPCAKVYKRKVEKYSHAKKRF